MSKKILLLLCLSMSFSWASDPHKALKEERYKYMKLYADEKRKQATYKKELNKLGNLKDIQNASLQLQYYTYVNKELLEEHSKFTRDNPNYEKKYLLWKKRYDYLVEQIPIVIKEREVEMKKYGNNNAKYNNLRKELLKLIEYADKNLTFHRVQLDNYKYDFSYKTPYYNSRFYIVFNSFDYNKDDLDTFNVIDTGEHKFYRTMTIPRVLTNGIYLTPLIDQGVE